MLGLGIISIIQAIFLPGFIIGFLIKNIRWMDRLLLAFPLSLVANYSVVLMLTLSGLYTRPMLIAVVGIEIAIIYVLMAKEKNLSMQGSALAILPRMPQSFSLKIVDMTIISILICFSIFFFYGAWKQIGTVFNLWDDVVSWNRWAITWYHGELPHGTWQYPYASQTYPQGIPILYSLTYLFIGDDRVQFFAKIISISFPIFAFASLIRVAFVFVELRNITLLAVSVFIWMLSHGYAGIFFIFSGLVEAPMAYFGVFSIYIFLLLLHRAQQPEGGLWKDSLSYLAVISVSGAALVKQPGILLAVIFPLALYFYLGQKQRGGWRNWKVLCSLIFTCILVLHWYVYKVIEIYRGLDTSLISAYESLIPGSWFLRPISGGRMLFDTIGWAWIPAFIAGLFNPNARKLAILGVLPVFMLWAFFVSYDLRALFLAFPWVSMIIAVGCVKIYGLIYSKPKFSPFVIGWLVILFSEIIYKSPAMVSSMVEFGVSHEQIPIQFILICIFGMIVILIGICGAKFLSEKRTISVLIITILLSTIYGVCATTVATKDKLINSSITQQQQIGYPKVNKFLLEYFLENESSNEYVATSYQLIGFIPGLQQYFKLAQCKDFSFLSMKAVKYYLYTPLCPISDKEQFEKMMGDNVEKIKEQEYALYKIKR